MVEAALSWPPFIPSAANGVAFSSQRRRAAALRKEEFDGAKG